MMGFFRDLMRGKAPGPSSSFSEFDLAKAIEIIGTEGAIGRKRLSEKLRIGEGTVRTMTALLKKASLIRITKSGCDLTEKGRAILDEITSGLVCVSPINSKPLTIGSYSVGILVRGHKHKVRQGIEQRDAAIKAGAIGAAILLFKNGKLIMPSISEDVAKDYPNVAKRIMEVLHPKDSDIIVLGSADTRDCAEDGARAAAWTLMEDQD